jgi:hypothetical protein
MTLHPVQSIAVRVYLHRINAAPQQLTTAFVTYHQFTCLAWLRWCLFRRPPGPHRLGNTMDDPPYLGQRVQFGASAAVPLIISAHWCHPAWAESLSFHRNPAVARKSKKPLHATHILCFHRIAGYLPIPEEHWVSQSPARGKAVIVRRAGLTRRMSDQCLVRLQLENET